MKKLPSDYTAEFEFKLKAIYQKQPDEFKKRVEELDFATSFSIIFVNGKPRELERATDFEMSDELFNQIRQAYDTVYKQ